MNLMKVKNFGDWVEVIIFINCFGLRDNSVFLLIK